MADKIKNNCKSLYKYSKKRGQPEKVKDLFKEAIYLWSQKIWVTA